jgi:type I restriction enzyme S subunit
MKFMRAVPLGHVLDVDRAIASEDECRTMPYVGLEHIEKESGRFSDDFRPKPEQVLATKFRFTPEHVLYGKLRPYLNKVALPHFRGVCTTEILPLLPKPGNLERGYLYAALLSSRFVNWASQNVSGANLPRLAPDRLLEYEICLPDVAEQKRIAAILERTDRLRRLRRYALEVVDSFLPAAFDEVFGSPSEACERWPTMRLDDCCRRITDGTHLTPAFLRQGVPFIFVKNVRNGQIDFNTDKFITPEVYAELYARCPVEKNDILYTIVGATYGQAALVNRFTKFAFQRHVAHLKPNPKIVDPKFLENMMQLTIVKSQADRWARGAAQPTVNLKELKEFLIPVPPLDVQQNFAGLMERVERARRVDREALRQAEHLFQTLLHRLFANALIPGKDKSTVCQ